MDNVTLVLFTCTGREHLLKNTITSFKESSNYTFSATILAVDGSIESSVIGFVNPDILIQNIKRKGYIFNIINALSRVETPYFFWLEDDWEFIQKLDLEQEIKILAENRNWSEIVFTRHVNLANNQLFNFIKNGYYSMEGFSANPCICRTEHIKNAFQALKETPKSESTKVVGFENFLSAYFASNNTYSIAKETLETPFTRHSGELESTAREYHMINSLDTKLSDVGKEYISGFGSDRTISFKSKLFIIPKLLFVTFALLTKVFSGRKYYDMAFRTFLAIKNSLKRD
jgi:hypothetical protein